jgi:hypothetical protein
MSRPDGDVAANEEMVTKNGKKRAVDAQAKGLVRRIDIRAEYTNHYFYIRIFEWIFSQAGSCCRPV